MVRMAEQTENATMTEAGPAAGERALMRAVLEDAIHCLLREIGPVRERPQLAAEARAWIHDSNLRWPFSFENVCGHLDCDPERLRSRLRRDAPELPAIDNSQQASGAARPRRETPAEHEIMQMIREGRPLRVVAETFGISISQASILSCGLASRIKAERDDEIRRLRSAGWTHHALAARFSLSRIRIMRICARPVDEGRSAAGLAPNRWTPQMWALSPRGGSSHGEGGGQALAPAAALVHADVQERGGRAGTGRRPLRARDLSRAGPE